MLFNSMNFILFFSMAVMLYFIVPKKMRYIWLLICSYIFYMSWNPKYILLLMLITLNTYCGGLLIAGMNADPSKRVRRKVSFILCLIINFGALFFFKYTDFLLGSLFDVYGFNLLLPVGISFFIFQSAGYVIDIYKNHSDAERNIVKYALFVSFFPNILSGPIERGKDFLPQIHKCSEMKLWDYRRVTLGVVMMLWGYFVKMVIADRIAILVDTVFDSYYMYGTIVLVVAAIGFSIQIYCDFYGYSTIAIGAARVMGFQLRNNFDVPYFSMSVREFWHRWHISLSTWFRDYVYIPLGGNRCSKGRKYFNTLVTFLLSGLWHGSNWTFLFWGGLHGVMQIVETAMEPIKELKIYKTYVKQERFSYKFGKVLFTFCFVTLAWIFFRADSIQIALNYIRRMLTLGDWWVLSDGTLYTLGLSVNEISILMISLLMLFAVSIVKYKRKIDLDVFLMEQSALFRYTVVIGMLFAVIIWGIYGPAFNSAQFLYFDF